MATYFINYDATVDHISINTFRKPAASAGDICDVVAGIRAGESVCCDLDGAKDALEDGSLWTDEDQPALEALHWAIREAEADA